MWILIIFLLLISLVLMIGYFIKLFSDFKFIKKLFVNEKKRILFVFIIFSIITLLLVITLNFMNTVVGYIYLFLFFMFFNLITVLLKKKSNHGILFLVSLVVTIGYLSYGYYLDHHVVLTTYDLTSDKISSDKKIVQLTDIHIGTTFNVEKLKEYVDDINKLEPDIVVFTGDLFDELADIQMVKDAVKALENIKTKDGFYFVLGNHDRFKYSNDINEDQKQVIDIIRYSSITLLYDGAINIGDDIVLYGRKDKNIARLDVKDLMFGVDESKYIMVLDHEPTDYENLNGNADLVLSGHTHGGQLFPINNVGVILGINDFTYGHKNINGTDFIVSSGMSNWSFIYKTGCKSEYVLINLRKKN